MNTSYFHAVANQRCRKKRIECLQGPSGSVHDTPKIHKIAVNYYKDLFKKEDSGAVSLDENFWSHEEKASNAENLELELPF
jgi:hypothetical protein